MSLSWHRWCDATLLTAGLLITESEIPVKNSHTSPLILFRFVYQSGKLRKGCNLANLFLVAEDTRIQSYSATDHTSGRHLTAANRVSSSRSLALNGNMELLRPEQRYLSSIAECKEIGRRGRRKRYLVRERFSEGKHVFVLKFKLTIPDDIDGDLERNSQ